jgi:hypothetical protein
VVFKDAFMAKVNANTYDKDGSDLSVFMVALYMLIALTTTRNHVLRPHRSSRHDNGWAISLGRAGAIVGSAIAGIILALGGPLIVFVFLINPLLRADQACIEAASQHRQGGYHALA